MNEPKIVQLPLGPLQTNCYILADTETKMAAVVDPSWNGRGLAVAGGDDCCRSE